MDALTVTHALRNIVAGMAEIAIIIVALIAMAWAVTMWLNRGKPAPVVKPFTSRFPTPKRERALESANRTPVVLPKRKP